MTETQQFIEDAIKGEWRKSEKPDLDKGNDGFYVCFNAGHDTRTYWESDILLDPLVWQAVGKTRGWDNGEHVDPTYEFASTQTWMWQWKWHRFIDYLTGGLSIEEALKAIR